MIEKLNISRIFSSRIPEVHFLEISTILSLVNAKRAAMFETYIIKEGTALCNSFRDSLISFTCEPTPSIWVCNRETIFLTLISFASKAPTSRLALVV